MPFETLAVTLENHIATVRLNRPEKLNAMNAAMWRELYAGVHAIAATIAAKSPLSIRGTKEMITYARDHSLADSLNYVATWNAAMLKSDDFDEAMQANMAKRAPSLKD